MTGEEARERFLDGLTARDASPHTKRAYTTVVDAYLAWLAARGVDWRRPARADLRAYLGRLGEGVSRASVGQRLAALRSFYRFTTRSGWTDGDPWGAIATPRMPRRLPRVLEVEEVERLLDAISAAPGDPLALRDRAIVETAYAAGLRISELATAGIGSVDLSRGEIRVVGKGRKERVGLLDGRPGRRSPRISRTADRSCLLGHRNSSSRRRRSS